jgi:RNA polymerase sigma-54 factor
MIKQSLNFKLLQKLSPQHIQFIKLLQVPTAMLDQRVKEELEENPALEEGGNDSEVIAEALLYASPDSDNGGNDGDKSTHEFENNGIDDDYSQNISSPDSDALPTDAFDENTRLEEFDMSEYLQDYDDTPEYKLNDYNYSPDDDDNFNTPVVVTNSFYDQLEDQLATLTLTETDYLLGLQIIGSIDEDGYLRRQLPSIVDDLAFTQNIQCTDEDAERLLKMIQKFEPAGIAARTLQECLLLQLRRLTKAPDVLNALKIIEDYFDEYSKKHYNKIERGLSLTADQLKAANDEILRLNPKPGGGEENSKTLQIIPDFIIHNNDNGDIELKLNARNAPELRISGSYKEMLKDYEKDVKKDKKMKDAVGFIKQKIDSAKWFIDAIKQRQNTLWVTMTAIMEHQIEFFVTGDDTRLKPMILKDIAEEVGLDISTVSRVANSKYVQTEYGTYLLKSFFSEGIMTDSGEEASSKEVKSILQDCVTHEDKRKPLSDDRLAEILNEKGYNIARRTVAKYREQINIPVARLRKEL